MYVVYTQTDTHTGFYIYMGRCHFINSVIYIKHQISVVSIGTFTYHCTQSTVLKNHTNFDYMCYYMYLYMQPFQWAKLIPFSQDSYVAIHHEQ